MNCIISQHKCVEDGWVCSKCDSKRDLRMVCLWFGHPDVPAHMAKTQEWRSLVNALQTHKWFYRYAETHIFTTAVSASWKSGRCFDKYAYSAQRPSAPTIHHVLVPGKGGGVPVVGGGSGGGGVPVVGGGVVRGQQTPSASPKYCVGQLGVFWHTRHNKHLPQHLERHVSHMEKHMSQCNIPSKFAC